MEIDASLFLLPARYCASTGRSSSTLDCQENPRCAQNHIANSARMKAFLCQLRSEIYGASDDLNGSRAVLGFAGAPRQCVNLIWLFIQMIFPPKHQGTMITLLLSSSCALAPGVIRTVASYSSTIAGPVTDAFNADRAMTGVSIQPNSIPK